MTTFDYREARSYTSRYGAVVGGMWIASFAFFIIGLRSPLAGNLCLITGVTSVVTAGWFIRRFRATHSLKFMQALWMSLQFYLYASLLMAAAQYIYFRYMDNGLLADTMEAVMDMPAYREMLTSMLPNGENPEELTTQVVETFRATPAIEITFSMLFNNLMLGIFLCLPTTIIGMTGKTGNNLQNK